MTVEKRLNSPAYQDLKHYGYGASLTGSRFNGLHGVLMTELFNKETKGAAGPFRSGYSTDMQSVNTWVRTSHIHCRLRIELKQKMRLLTFATHKELTPRRHAEHVNSLKKTLKTYQVDLFSDGQLFLYQLEQKLTIQSSMVFWVLPIQVANVTRHSSLNV